MEAGASSTKSSASNANPSIVRESVLQLAQKSKDASSASSIQDLQAQARADAARIQTLEAQVRELKSSEFSEKRHAVTQSQLDAPHTDGMKTKHQPLMNLF
jgi:negative regulator of replication initiation